jgi:RNA polymerase subunit RPABC4/transcription elongation factor Spt4
MKRCKSCRRMVESKAKHCPGCGKTLGFRRCLACSDEGNAPDAGFCRACGATTLTNGTEVIGLSLVPPLVLLAVGAGLVGVLWLTGVPSALEHWLLSGVRTAGTSVKVLFIYIVNRTLMFVIICTILYRLMPAVLREPVTAFVKIVTDAILNLLRIGVKLLQLPFKKKKKSKEKDDD